jgi:hypothetical protein
VSGTHHDQVQENHFSYSQIVIILVVVLVLDFYEDPGTKAPSFPPEGPT